MKKRVLILLSKNEDFLGSAVKIKDGLDYSNTEILYIEDICNNPNISKDDIIYFLCNGECISKLINKIKNTGCTIINANYFEKNYSKLTVQSLVGEGGVLVPKFIDYAEIENVKFPVFCKENKHAGIVFKAFNILTIKNFFSKFNSSDFYLEESLNDIGTYEMKIYYVDGEIAGKDGEVIINDSNILKICNNISKILELSVFSADFIKKDSNYYLIDLNPAAGFYFSTISRNNLIYMIKELL
jgi:hypothetical protein